jgi:2-oxoglutarate ferredoxin oxidoreductase subunit delta
VKGRIVIDKERCKGCGLCIIFCPKKQISISDELNKKGYYPAAFAEESAENPEMVECTGCALCGTMCPDVAIEVYRQDKSESKDKAEED